MLTSEVYCLEWENIFCRFWIYSGKKKWNSDRVLFLSEGMQLISTSSDAEKHSSLTAKKSCNTKFFLLHFVLEVKENILL